MICLAGVGIWESRRRQNPSQIRAKTAAFALRQPAPSILSVSDFPNNGKRLLQGQFFDT
jgi:hypothetical protein